MKILITGARGFIGKNLIERLSTDKNLIIYQFDSDTPLLLLDDYLKDCDFVFNFAAVHRPKNSDEFKKVNCDFFKLLLDKLESYNNHCPVLYTSSIQSNNGSDYGTSKFMAEQLLRSHSKKMHSRAIIYRLTNIFGKWARPNAHSVVATFCYNVVNNLPLTVSNQDIVMHFAYIDDVIDSFLERLHEGLIPVFSDQNIYSIHEDKIIEITLGHLAELISSFKSNSDFSDVSMKLNSKELLFYITYLSYLRS